MNPVSLDSPRCLIRPNVARKLASRRLAAAWWRRLANSVRRGPVRGERLELVGLPFFRLLWRLERGIRQGEITVLVCGGQGDARLVRGALELTPLDALASFDAPRTVSLFEPRLGPEAAEISARRLLHRAVLQAPGWGATPRVGELLRGDVVHWPYWVRYFERRGGRWDFQMLDGVSGKPVGGKMRLALLDALSQTSTIVERAAS